MPIVRQQPERDSWQHVGGSRADRELRGEASAALGYPIEHETHAIADTGNGVQAGGLHDQQIVRVLVSGIREQRCAGDSFHIIHEVLHAAARLCRWRTTKPSATSSSKSARSWSA